MRCSECGAEMPVHREFCPECDAPTDPQLLARWKASRGKAADPGRSTEELHANRKKLLIGGVGLLLVLGVMGKLSLPGLPSSVVNMRPRSTPRPSTSKYSSPIATCRTDTASRRSWPSAGG